MTERVLARGDGERGPRGAELKVSGASPRVRRDPRRGERRDATRRASAAPMARGESEQQAQRTR